MSWQESLSNNSVWESPARGLATACSNFLSLAVPLPSTGLDRQALELFGHVDFAFARSVIKACIDEEHAARSNGRLWSVTHAAELDHLPELWRLMRVGQEVAFPSFCQCLAQLLAPKRVHVIVRDALGAKKVPFLVEGIVRRLAAALLLNALRHGYSSGCSGLVVISISIMGYDDIQVSVVDDGGGANELIPGEGHRLRLRLCGLVSGSLRLWIPASGGFAVDAHLTWPKSLSTSSLSPAKSA